MPGDDWQKFANLRLLFGYMYGHPGEKASLYGERVRQWDEWYHEKSLDWLFLSILTTRRAKMDQDLNHL